MAISFMQPKKCILKKTIKIATSGYQMTSWEALQYIALRF